MKRGARTINVWVLLLQFGALVFFVGFIKIAVPERADSMRAIGHYEGGRQMQGDLIDKGVFSPEDIPKELRYYPEKGIYIEADLNLEFYRLILFLPALLCQFLAIALTMYRIYQERKSKEKFEAPLDRIMVEQVVPPKSDRSGG